MYFVHYSKQNIKKFKTRHQLEYSWKPIGLWMTKLNNDWYMWNKYENIKMYKYIFKLTTTNILHIDLYNKSNVNELLNKYPNKMYSKLLNWKLISKDYNGIYFTNCEYNKKLHDLYEDYISDYKSGGSWVISLDIDCLCMFNIKKCLYLKSKKLI